MPPKVISGGDNPYDIHDAKLSSSATAHESSSVTGHEISNNWILRAIHLNFFVIRRYYGWIQIQIYNPIFPLIKDLIMVYHIRKYDCKIPFFHMVQFLTNTKFNTSFRYIDNFNCLV